MPGKKLDKNQGNTTKPKEKLLSNSFYSKKSTQELTPQQKQALSGDSEALKSEQLAWAKQMKLALENGEPIVKPNCFELSEKMNEYIEQYNHNVEHSNLGRLGMQLASAKNKLDNLHKEESQNNDQKQKEIKSIVQQLKNNDRQLSSLFNKLIDNPVGHYILASPISKVLPDNINALSIKSRYEHYNQAMLHLMSCGPRHKADVAFGRFKQLVNDIDELLFKQQALLLKLEDLSKANSSINSYQGKISKLENEITEEKQKLSHRDDLVNEADNIIEKIESGNESELDCFANAESRNSLRR